MPKKSILIVDDEEDVVSALQFRLTMAGCDIITAPNGAEALRVLQRQKIDLILADFMMPEVNGMELTRLVKAKPEWSETKIMLFSCNVEPEHRRRALELGAADYIHKTKGANAIVKRVYELLALEADEPQRGSAEDGQPRAGKPSARAQLQSLCLSLIDILHLAAPPENLPETTRYALDSARRVAADIRLLAEVPGARVPEADQEQPKVLTSQKE